jgi:DNA-binding response OmpR family regulator
MHLRVRSILRRTGTPAGADASSKPRVVQFSGWRFNAGNNILIVQDGSEYNLSTAEAQLLKVFLAQPNRILTREQLLNERDVSPYDRSIDMRISRLRRKLEIDLQNPKLIRTVYGRLPVFERSELTVIGKLSPDGRNDNR